MKKINLFLLGTLVIISGVLSGCAFNKCYQPLLISKNPNLSWQNYFKQLSSIQKWRLNGYVGVVTQKQSGSANINWNYKSENNYCIQIFGPLGIDTTTLKATQKDNLITLKTSKNKIYTGHSAENLLNKMTGWRVPIKGMENWVKGIPDPNLFYTLKLNRYGMPSDIIQSGWNIEYKHYRLLDQKIPVAEYIILKRRGVFVKLKINNINF